MKELFARHVIVPLRAIRAYFANGHTDIAATNLAMMSSVSFLGSLATALLILAARLVMDDWLPTPAHIMLLVFFVLFTGIIHVMRRFNASGYRLVQFALSAYLLCVVAFLLYLDLIAYDITSVTMPVCAMVGLSVLFILAPWQAGLLLGGTTVAILVLLSKYTAPQFVDGQQFYCLFGMVVGLLLYWVTISLRARDSATRTELVRYSELDQLTGILNKGATEKCGNAYITGRGTEGCTLIVLDVDDFKAVNDNNGHPTGDKVLALVGRELKATFRESDIVGRIGGDEFLALVKNLSNPQLMEHKLASFTHNMHAAIAAECKLDITCSIGGIMVSGEGITYAELFSYADNLLYRAKRSGKNTCKLLPLSEFTELKLQRKRMLIVDDEEVNLSLLNRIFGEEYQIETAHNGEEALALIERDKMRFSVVVLDLIMPKLDGRGVLRVLQADPALRNVPVIIVSADEKSELQMLELGVADMITRPFDPRIVRQRVANAVKHWHPAAQ